MEEEMARDPKVFLIGEEVGQFQGAYKVHMHQCTLQTRRFTIDLDRTPNSVPLAARNPYSHLRYSCASVDEFVLCVGFR